MRATGWTKIDFKLRGAGKARDVLLVQSILLSPRRRTKQIMCHDDLYTILIIIFVYWRSGDSECEKSASYLGGISLWRAQLGMSKAQVVQPQEMLSDSAG